MKDKSWEEIQEMIKTEQEAASKHYKELPMWMKRIEAKMRRVKENERDSNN